MRLLCDVGTYSFRELPLSVPLSETLIDPSKKPLKRGPNFENYLPGFWMEAVLVELKVTAGSIRRSSPW